MTFSEFVKMLYPIMGTDQKTSEFIPYLVEQITKFPDTENNDSLPCFKLEANTLDKIFNGSRNLSKKNARIIIEHLNKDKFADFLSTYPNDVIDMIGSALRKQEIPFIDNEAIDACTNLFVSILADCAKITKKEKIISYNLYDVITGSGYCDKNIIEDLNKRGFSIDYIAQMKRYIYFNPSFYEYLKDINLNYICKPMSFTLGKFCFISKVFLFLPVTQIFILFL